MLLLDTHSLIWWVAGDERMRQREILGDKNITVFASAISAYEIALKFNASKLPSAERLATNFKGEIAQQLITELPLSAAHGQFAGRLDPAHKDPFDRMLAAQAILENLTIVSSDTALDRFGVQRIW